MSDTEFAVELDTSLYRLSAIKKTAYKFGDRCHVHLDALDGGRVRVALRAKRVTENMPSLIGEFQNELLDQELREVVAQETEGIRNLLLAQAFSAISLIDPQGDSANVQTDPLNIRLSDRQKNTAHADPNQRGGV